MTTYALVNVGCPHCSGQFLENAKLVRRDGAAWCPHCEKLFTLDPGNQAVRRTLAEAKAARRRRKDRLAELRSTWSDTTPPPKPLLMGDVLRALDELLQRLDGMVERRRS